MNNSPSPRGFQRGGNNPRFSLLQTSEGRVGCISVLGPHLLTWLNRKMSKNPLSRTPGVPTGMEIFTATGGFRHNH